MSAELKVLARSHARIAFAVSLAIAGAAAALFARRYPGRRTQYIAAIPLGALAGVIGMFVVVLQLQATDYFGWPFYLTAAAAGALALLVCTWLFDRLVAPRLQRRL